MDLAKLRAWYWHKLGLDGSLRSRSAAELHESIGWARSVGGSNPYIQTYSRNRTSREAFDQLVADGELAEIPSARGCTYTVSRADFALSLKVSQGFADEASMATAVKFLGVTEREIRNLESRIVALLESGKKDPNQLKDELGDAIRNLGPEGKKRGATTTLPVALGNLRTRGIVRNRPLNGRVDTQRYTYELWPSNPLDGFLLSREDAFAELAKRYFRWIGPARSEDFAWFSGLGKIAARAAADSAGLVEAAHGSGFLLHRDELDSFRRFSVPDQYDIKLVGALDNISHLRRCLGDLVESEDLHRLVPGERGEVPLGGLSELCSNAIYDRGRLIGVWEFDHSTGTIAWRAWSAPRQVVEVAVAEMEAFCRDQLGDARSFSLDSPKSRQPRIDLIRGHVTS